MISLLYRRPGPIPVCGDSELMTMALQRPGVPVPVVARKILKQRRLSDGLEAVVRARRSIGVDYVLTSPYGVANLEISATECDCQYLLDEVCACANHVRSTALKHLEAGLYGLDSFFAAWQDAAIAESGPGFIGFGRAQGDPAGSR
jgi:hypothetical protein